MKKKLPASQDSSSFAVSLCFHCLGIGQNPARTTSWLNIVRYIFISENNIILQNGRTHSAYLDFHKSLLSNTIVASPLVHTWEMVSTATVLKPLASYVALQARKTGPVSGSILTPCQWDTPYTKHWLRQSDLDFSLLGHCFLLLNWQTLDFNKNKRVQQKKSWCLYFWGVVWSVVRRKRQ